MLELLIEDPHIDITEMPLSILFELLPELCSCLVQGFICCQLLYVNGSPFSGFLGGIDHSPALSSKYFAPLLSNSDLGVVVKPQSLLISDPSWCSPVSHQSHQSRLSLNGFI